MRKMERKKRLKYLYPGIAWLTILTMIISSLGFKEIVEAITTDPLIEANIVYSADHRKASIVFDLTSVNQEIAEIIKITSENDGEIVYEANRINQSSDYDVTENGDYHFKVTYRSASLLANQNETLSAESEAIESTQVTVKVDGIQPTSEITGSDQQLPVDSEENAEASVEVATTETTDVASNADSSEVMSSTDMSQEQSETSNTVENTKENSQTEEGNEASVNEENAISYPQELLLRGLGISGNENKVKFKVDPETYNISAQLMGGGYRWHSYFSSVYYRITAYKKDAVLGDSGTLLLEVKGTDNVQQNQMTQMTTFDFEEGDMIQIWSPESRFNFLGDPVIASDGINTINYATSSVPKEKFQNSVYEITSRGFKEIYNAAPTATGQEIPLYSLYGQGDWSDGELATSAIYSNMVFKDDRNEQGIYQPDGYTIEEKTGAINYVTNNRPAASVVSGCWTMRYTITDSWGRQTTINRESIKLPKFDSKITIEEMEEKIVDGKKVEGFVHFPEATVNTKDHTVTLSSSVVINANPQWEACLVIPYGGTERTRMIKSSTGDLQEVDLGGKYRIPADQITSVTIKKDPVTVIATDYQVDVSETQIASWNETELKNQIKERLAQVIGTASSNLADAEIVLDSKLQQTNPKAGSYQGTLKFTNTSGTIEQTFHLNVTENSWSYDIPERTETNGASGFVVIPKGIDLQRDHNNPNQLSATSEVYFANYMNATGVTFQVSVDNTFEMTNVIDNSNKFTVTATSNNNQKGTSNGQLALGNLSSTNTKGNGLSVTFTAPTDKVDRTKGRWQGNVQFYIERQ
ncbi:hypothetical protein [Enterococcus sp. AZ172]|uniref:hypothetical protein n=1 Tax=unclassified Enterococcus TaxID=2608891 RepID=UPI003F6861C9